MADKTTVRVCVDIPIDQHKIIKEYNKTTSRPVNITRVCLLAIEKEVEAIKEEQKKE